ncbi:hypothetical protein CRUP_034043 [Coryphaenoides rupestris]|nr:hypothetical protein CRUP_034043 [Coryphaenoides rupestris]
MKSAFCQITLAFRTDQYTLKQRLQAEEHARDLAEENVQQELSRGRETLESLKGLCLDMRRSAILQRLELSLDILGGTVERISTAAEVLGSVHQEARVCRAVEIMVAHVENLKRRHDRHGVELEQTKRLVHRVSRRNLTDPGVQPADVHEMELQKQSFQHDKRRRELKRQASLGDARCPSPTFSSESSCSFLTRDDICSLDGRPSAAWRPFPLTCWLFHPCWGVLYVSLFLILIATMLSLFS